jgi:hypothetical protein
MELSTPELVDYFKPFFENYGMVIDQPWHQQMTNGMVRCYACGDKVAGFGYQEINALYEYEDNGKMIAEPAGKRYYFTERCGLFADLKSIMEQQWIPQMMEILAIRASELPVIWDADFFINTSHHESADVKYTLCEINVSCVSPFPPSTVKFMVDEVRKRLL